ncbi:hypothetical protein [Fodinibius saliphilus]|nr:hypothetical protein [Fodinibius saliphilus]
MFIAVADIMAIGARGAAEALFDMNAVMPIGNRKNLDSTARDPKSEK